MSYRPEQRGNTAVLVLGVLAAIALLAWLALHIHGQLEDERVKRAAAESALKTERDLRTAADEKAGEFAADAKAQKERADANRTELRKALAERPDCSVSAAAADVLRGVAQPAQPAAPADRAGSTAPQADPAPADRAGDGPASCAAIAVWAQRNLDEVCIPNALQLQRVQELYEKQRGLLDRR